MNKWDIRFLKLAQHVSEWSKDPSTKCGAVIATGKHVLGLGFNGFPPGIEDRHDHLHNRDEKYPRVVHAELNAIFAALMSRQSTEGSTLYTWPPGLAPSCDRCTVHVIAAGIKRVVYVEEDNEFSRRWAPDRSLELYREAGVEIVAVKNFDGYVYSERR